VEEVKYLKHFLAVARSAALFRPVFFNLLTAAKPHTSVKVTHETPCIDPWVQRRTRG